MEGKIAMANHIRVLAESDQKAPLGEVRKILGPDFEVIVEEGIEDDWSQLLLKHSDGPEIALLERDLVSPGELGEQQLQELSAEVEHAQPHRAVEWLKHYFSHVKIVYLLEPMSGANVKDGWSAISRTEAYLWRKFEGILQADNEGFTNREGHHVVWQFHGPQQGQLEAAVMDETGQWTTFIMDTSDPEQVAAFQRGEVPAKAARNL